MFNKNFHWRRFMERSLNNAKDCAYVVTCDISEFYLRLSHHRIENALNQAQIDHDIPWRIMEFLANFSNTNSYGIPVGGPAARLVSELVLNQIDRLLKAEGIRFCRFVTIFIYFAIAPRRRTVIYYFYRINCCRTKASNFKNLKRA